MTIFENHPMNKATTRIVKRVDGVLPKTLQQVIASTTLKRLDSRREEFGELDRTPGRF